MTATVPPAPSENPIPDPAGRVELPPGTVLTDARFVNDDLLPVPLARRRWTTSNFTALWVGGTLVLLIFPGIFVVLVGPAAVTIVRMRAMVAGAVAGSSMRMQCSTPDLPSKQNPCSPPCLRTWRRCRVVSPKLPLV